MNETPEWNGREAKRVNERLNATITDYSFDSGDALAPPIVAREYFFIIAPALHRHQSRRSLNRGPIGINQPARTALFLYRPPTAN
ncbi:hypothetical protein [Ferribacterium limneticum]|uniref:hypothetical protein n=1 Tax=Ferribacterium limneticum TaxID=76259 RepID=UPI001CFC33E3|nr:hypothetical protein [Ferribacterium limneticum]UCV29419.1 hypothetical protein KI617_04810 [Ferribacterium limneticum]UCV33338.1 hypothetical protein KI608_04810 [Ferribacterium limneticum]